MFSGAARSSSRRYDGENPEGWVTKPKAKINLLRNEAARIGAGHLIRAREIAAALRVNASTFSEYFGATADVEGSRPPHRHLAAIARKYGTIGVVVEIEWFFDDREEFENRVIAARRSRRRAPIHDIDVSWSTDQWEVADTNNISKELAALHIHPPPPSNDPNTFLLPASLSLASYPDEIGDLAVRIGLKAAYLVPTMSGCQPAEIPEQAGLTALQSLNLWGTLVSNVSPLAGLSALQSLNLWGTLGSNVSPLAGLTALRSLNLAGTWVRDVWPLAGLTALQNLDLTNTQVSDVSPLAHVRNLKADVEPPPRLRRRGKTAARG